VALDGVGEFLENLPKSRSLRGNGERLRLLATDQPVQWTIIRDPARFTWAQADPDPRPPAGGAPTVTVHASTGDLYLLLWGRRPTTDPRLTVTGDPALLAHWRQHAVIT
jgi:hypothetical protein